MSNAANTQIMITRAAFKALGGKPKHAKDALFPLRLMRHDLNRLSAARSPGESYSDAILRLAEQEREAA